VSTSRLVFNKSTAQNISKNESNNTKYGFVHNVKTQPDNYKREINTVEYTPPPSPVPFELDNDSKNILNKSIFPPIPEENGEISKGNEDVQKAEQITLQNSDIDIDDYSSDKNMNYIAPKDCMNSTAFEDPVLVDKEQKIKAENTFFEMSPPPGFSKKSSSFMIAPDFEEKDFQYSEPFYHQPLYARRRTEATPLLKKNPEAPSKIALSSPPGFNNSESIFSPVIWHSSNPSNTNRFNHPTFSISEEHQDYLSNGGGVRNFSEDSFIGMDATDFPRLNVSLFDVDPTRKPVFEDITRPRSVSALFTKTDVQNSDSSQRASIFDMSCDFYVNPNVSNWSTSE